MTKKRTGYFVTNDYTDTLDFRKGWVWEVGVIFFVLKVPDYESTMLIYLYMTTN